MSRVSGTDGGRIGTRWWVRPSEAEARRRKAARAGSADQTPRWKITDAMVLVLAALRVMLPYLAVILAAILVGWGLWVLAF